MQELLARHRDDARLAWQKPLVCEYLASNYDPFFDASNKLLQSSNYIVRRQMVKLVQEIILERDNVDIMMRFSSSLVNLKARASCQLASLSRLLFPFILCMSA